MLVRGTGYTNDPCVAPPVVLAPDVGLYAALALSLSDVHVPPPGLENDRLPLRDVDERGLGSLALTPDTCP